LSIDKEVKEMDLNLNDDQKMIQETAAQIAQKELAPTSAQRDIEGTFPKDGLRKLAEAGFLGMVVPKPLGGSGAWRNRI
jgi:hypothetical protein